jgi:hypothetical protein
MIINRSVEFSQKKEKEKQLEKATYLPRHSLLQPLIIHFIFSSSL